MERIDIADFLLIAERITGVDARTIARRPETMARAERALAAPFTGFGDFEAFPSLAARAAVYASRIIRYHPLVDGNKRAARVVMREFVARNGCTWTPAAGGWEEEARVIEDLAAGTLSEERFILWVVDRIADGGESVC